MPKIEKHSKSSRAKGTIKLPRPNAPVYDQAIPISGTIEAGEDSLSPRIVRALIDNVCIGETQIFRQSSPEEGRFGYEILGRLPEPITAPRQAVIVITLAGHDQNAPEKLDEITVQLVPARLQDRHYGEVVPPDQAKVLHRENIYGSGPPIEEASHDLLSLVLGYLPPRSSIVDVGCGAGAFASGLMKAGHQWLGLEMNEHCLDLLARRGLPFRKIERATARFPCRDREFDHAICIEVLEHVNDPGAFLSEIVRVVQGRALFSVPNMEVIPYLSPWQVVPWHLLEGDHKNFFTRTSLRTLLARHFAQVGVFSYAEHPLRTRDDIALHIHLFAVATG